jgi:hypothetical protein
MTALPNPPYDGNPPLQSATSEMVQHHSVRISRSFEVVEREIAELGERWLEDAVRSAIQHGQDSIGDSRENGPFLHIRVRLGRPSAGPRAIALAVEWEVNGGAIPRTATGQLEVVEAGPDEAQVGVRMVPHPAGISEGDEERRRVDHILDIATRFLLNRLFWTLEALNRFEPLPRPPRKSPSRKSASVSRSWVN